MRVRILKYFTPLLQPIYRRYLLKTRSYRFQNIQVLVRPGVFFPGVIISTKLFLQYIRELDLSGRKLLELGAGSGIISVFAASKGSIVTASDINPVAVKNIIENATLNNVKITVIESDLFKAIPSFAFDYILIAPPYFPKDPLDYAEMAWYCGRNFEYFENLFMQMHDFYHSSAIVLMILSEDCNILRIKEIGSKFRFELCLVHQKRRLGEWNYIFRIYKSSHEIIKMDS